MKSSFAKPAVVVTVAIVATCVAVLGISGSRGDVPEWLRKKLEFEARYEEYVTKQSTKCAQEVATLEKRRSEAAKDEKGNPMLQQEHMPKPETLAPSEQMGVFQDTSPMQLPLPVRERLVCTTIAYAPYDILIAGSEKQDGSVGIIYDLRTSPDSYGFEELVSRLPGKGPIVLESLTEDNNVVTFRWGSEGKGYFDLRTRTAVFQEYPAR